MFTCLLTVMHIVVFRAAENCLTMTYSIQYTHKGLVGWGVVACVFVYETYICNLIFIFQKQANSMKENFNLFFIATGRRHALRVKAKPTYAIKQ